MMKITIRVDDPELEAAWRAIAPGRRNATAQEALRAYLVPAGLIRQLLQRLEAWEVRSTPAADPVAHRDTGAEDLAASVEDILNW